MAFMGLKGGPGFLGSLQPSPSRSTYQLLSIGGPPGAAPESRGRSDEKYRRRPSGVTMGSKDLRAAKGRRSSVALPQLLPSILHRPPQPAQHPAVEWELVDSVDPQVDPRPQLVERPFHRARPDTGRYSDREATPTRSASAALQPDMLCLAAGYSRIQHPRKGGRETPNSKRAT